MGKAITFEAVPLSDQAGFLTALAGNYHDRFLTMVHAVTKNATGIEFSYEAHDMISLSNGGGYVRPSGRSDTQGFVDASKRTEQFSFSGHSGETAKLTRDQIGMVATYIALNLFEADEANEADIASREIVGVNAERLAVYLLTDLGPFADQSDMIGTMLGLCHGPDVRKQYLR